MSVPQPTAAERGEHILAVFDTAFGELGRRPRGLPRQVPEDGKLRLRLLPGDGLPVLRGPGAGGPRRPLPGRAHRPGLDPRRSPRRELRHLHGRQRAADLQRQRLRRGLRRPLHLGHQAPRGLARPHRLREGAERRADHPPRPDLRGLLPGADPRPGDRHQDRRPAAVHSGHGRGRSPRRAPRRPRHDPVRAAGLHDGDPRVRAALRARRRIDRAGRGDPVQDPRRLRRLPGDAARGLPRPPRLVPGEGCGRTPRDRHRLGRPPRTTSCWRATATPWRTTSSST